MKTLIRHSHLFAMLAVLLVPRATFAAEDHESPLRDEMEAINHNFRIVNRQYADPAQKASTLDLVSAMHQHAEKARALTPPKAEKMSGDDKTRYIDAFHNHLDELMKELAALKQAVAADKTDIAKAEVAKIAQLKDSSHKELGVGGGGKHRGPPPGE